MKKTKRYSILLIALLLAAAFLFSSCGAVPGYETTSPVETTKQAETGSPVETTVQPETSGKKPDTPPETGSVTLDFYALNDTHGNVNGSDLGIGIAQLSSYLKSRVAANPNTVFLSSGDMWQGSSESNNTEGKLMTEWMNSLNFASMTLGNHEFDWSGKAIEENAALAEFPILAVNIYYKATNTPVTYCEPSAMIERGGVKIGIIGAIGDCYGSISASQVSDVKFIKGNELTALVKAESEKLRAQGAEIIVYSIHDGYSNSTYTSADSAIPTMTAAQMRDYYDEELSNGFVDVVFEGHTHRTAVYKDKYGVYHLQAGGYSQAVSHVNMTFDRAEKSVKAVKAELVFTKKLPAQADDADTLKIIEKYKEQIGDVYAVLGYNGTRKDSYTLKQLSAQLYLKAGLEKWGDKYDIVLGGGYTSCRGAYLEAGDICYADIQELFPFNNNIVLCSVSGAKLLDNFINTTNVNYFIDLNAGVDTSKINPAGTYYIVTDTYNSDYTYNSLTVIECYDENGYYARDLIAEYIKEGNYGTKPAEGTISSLLAKADGEACEITATALAVCSQGILIGDSSGSLYVYGGSSYVNSVKVGDTVRVSGAMGTYSGSRQIASPTVKVISSGTYEQPAPKALSAGEMDAYVNKQNAAHDYVKITGKLNVSGKYYNITVPGAVLVGSACSPTGNGLAELNGKNVEITGYFLYVNGSSTRYFTIIATSYKEVK